MNTRWVRRVALLAALGIAGAPAIVLARLQDTETRQATAASEPSTARLDAIRERLVEARFEAALAAIDTLLADPALTPTDRTEALALRAQAHVGLGDLDAVERDYRQILALRPGYEPAESLTSPKAMQRFRKARAETVGRLRLSLEPPGARVSVDGVPTVPDASGVVYALAGERSVRVENPGHDPDDRVVRVEADRETPLTIALLPNARTVVVRTEPDGVLVRVDGVEAGTTRRRADAGAGEPAELVLEHLALGEHLFELTRSCFASQTLRDVLTADLLDRSPKRYEPVRLLPARARLALHGGPPAADVRLDGEVVGRLPLGALESCPGEHLVDVRASGRTVWRERVQLVGSEESRIEVEPRPNLVLIAPDALAEAAAGFVSGFTLLERRVPSAGFAPTSAAGWTALDLPKECDLALVLVPSSRHGEADVWYLYSPILRVATALDGAPRSVPRPAWTVVTWGFRTADPLGGGAPVVVAVQSGSSAAAIGLRVGARLASVGGRSVSSSAEVRATLDAASVERPIRLAWSDPLGAKKEGDLIGRAGPRLPADRTEPTAASLLAGWALVDSIANPDHAATALGSLGLLFLDAGQPDLAEQAWRRVSWGTRAGIGEGTKAYYLGVALEAQGKEDAAAVLYRQAAATDARTFDDAGPEVAPAARDRLADLGVKDPSAR